MTSDADYFENHPAACEAAVAVSEYLYENNEEYQNICMFLDVLESPCERDPIRKAIKFMRERLEEIEEDLIEWGDSP